MSEGRVLLLAATAWIGVSFPVPFPLAAVVFTVAIAVLFRQEVLLVLAVGALASTLSSRAEQAYTPALRQTIGDQLVELITDPEPAPFGVRAEVKLVETNQRLRLSASGRAGETLRRAVAGERVSVRGRVTPIEPAPWLQSRHIVGSLAADQVAPRAGVAWYRLPSEWLRSAIRAGADSFDDDASSLYLGLVIGDDRFQTSAQEARFQAAGLTHLLAVSGQNVAFALAIAGPFLFRLGVNTRLLATGLVLVVFAIATRMEPSVVRATSTAAIASLSVVRGSRTTGTRALALAVTGLLLIDPFLALSVGFQLSVAASLGILLVGPSLRRRLPGPAWLTEPLSITMAAQLGVSPILLTVFGPVSLVTLPANLLAGSAAGAVMTLGLSAGVIAGFVPDSLATVIQVPSLLLVRWIDGVASVSAAMPAPVLDGSTLVLGGALLTTLAIVRTSKVLGGIVAVLIVGLLVASVPNSPTVITELAGGGTFFPQTDTTPSVLLVHSRSDQRLVEALVDSRVTSIDVVVLERGNSSTAQLMRNVVQIAPAGVILCPPLHRIVGGRRVLDPLAIVVLDGTQLRLWPDGTELETEVVAFGG